MFTNDDVKEMLSELDGMEQAALKARTLVREFRNVLDQPAFVDATSLGQVQRLIADGRADEYGVARNNGDTLLALLDKGREESQSIPQFKDTLFHLYRLTDMQVLFVRGAKEFFGSPIVVEVTQMADNSIVSSMGDILMKKDDNADEAGS